MKTLFHSFFVLAALGGALEAQPLSLSFDASVSNAEKMEDQIPQIPTQFEFQRRDGSVDLNDPKKLYIAFKRVHGPYFLPPTKGDDNIGADEDRNNPSIKDYKVNVLDLSLKTSSKGDLFLRSTGFLVFANFALIQNALIIPRICDPKDVNEEKNEAHCRIEFPSVQVAAKDLDNLSSIRFRVFRKGEISSSEIQALPTDVLPKLEDHLKANARMDVEDKNSGKRSGYFLYANYHFEAALKDSNEGMQIEKDDNGWRYEWRYPLSHAFGRLALLAGDYWLERETLKADGTKEIHVATTKLEWGTKTTRGSFKGKADLNWTKVEDPREYRPE